ncbi:MAG: T9SS type A sorting domain-containing protein [Paludibacter sp.]|nr:T9SS type A sorting domain-containing protein [Paludibacter sp.]
MKNINKNIILLAFFCLGVSTLNAQITILDESLMTQASFNKFTIVNVSGAQTWNHNSQYGATISGYAGGRSYANEDWFISPVMDLSAASNVKLSFDHTRGPAGMVNVGVSAGWYKVFASANYTGDPAATDWIEITNVQQPTSTWSFVSSGNLAIPAAAKSATARIAFRYISSDTQYATWEIKNVKVTGDPDYVNNPNVLKITNWNTEWLGCIDNGPDDENLQLNNVAAAIISINSDIYCLQEISNTNTINSLVSILGSSQWGGAITSTGNCLQRQGIIYKKSRVQLVNSLEINNGASAQGYTYSYNWSSGRFPALYNINFTANSQTFPISIINIHAKAFADADSYIRRKGGSQGLKPILDGSQYNTKKLIITGDFNDYLIGSTCYSYTDSPYKNFIDDASNYSGITKNLTNVGYAYYGAPLIENFIISNELFSNYISNSASQETSVLQSIYDYYNTTSDHLPVSAWFDFSNSAATDNVYSASNNLLNIFPNPVKNELQIENSQFENLQFEIIDLSGRQIINGNLSNTKSVNVSALPSGIYILKIGSLHGKFVKE